MGGRTEVISSRMVFYTLHNELSTDGPLVWHRARHGPSVERTWHSLVSSFDVKQSPLTWHSLVSSATGRSDSRRVCSDEYVDGIYDGISQSSSTKRYIFVQGIGRGSGRGIEEIREREKVSEGSTWSAVWTRGISSSVVHLCMSSWSEPII